jgi:prepilin peptidase CpaA
VPNDADVLRSVSLLILLGIAAYLDVRARRIPNWLTVSGLVVGLALAVVLWGWAAGRSALIGSGIALAVGFGLFALGVLGAGDAKLVAAVGAYFGTGRVLGALLAIAVCGGGLAVAQAIRARIMLPVLHATGRLIRYYLTFGRGVAERPSPVSGRLGEVPYGLAIAVGAAVWWFWGVPFP